MWLRKPQLYWRLVLSEGGEGREGVARGRYLIMYKKKKQEWYALASAMALWSVKHVKFGTKRCQIGHKWDKSGTYTDAL